ncbi:MAG: putative nicotinate-nucleotide adenylyltransferase [Phycisphaerales bacterium]|nr:MAG: putative nicotinate-nucleotide adenylyltransferase [Phycisphaerales bacterium]
MPIDAACRHVVLFGGTFDPPHMAHVLLADQARQAYERSVGEPAMLVFVPAARSPHKAQAPQASDAQRLEMLRLATAGLPRCAVWTDELDRAQPGQPSYWVDTLERARQAVGDRSLVFVIGADQAERFHRWHRPRRMLELAGVLVLPRGDIRTPAQLREAMAASGRWTPQELDRWAKAMVDAAGLPAASTEVRQAKGQPFETPLHPAVLRYARREHLYGL